MFDLVIGTLGDLRKLNDKSDEEADKFEAYIKSNVNFLEVTPRKLENLVEIKKTLSGLAEKAPKTPTKKVQASSPKDLPNEEDVIQIPKEHEEIESVVAKMPEKSVKIKRQMPKKVKEIKR